jgi:hypothetical protein
MSIHDAVNTACDGGSLHRVFPERGRRGIRELYIAAEINDRILQIGLQTEKERERWAYLRAELLDFVDEDHLPIPRECAKRSRRDPSYFKRLHPKGDEIWEIRANDRPRIRILGRLPWKDAFVGLVWRYRDYLDDDDERWRLAKEECLRAWAEITACAPPSGAYPHDYLSHTRFVP